MTKQLCYLTKRNLRQAEYSFLLTGLFLFLTSVVMAQTVNISGKVTGSSTGEGIPGANVVVKGTTTGTITDGNGDYSLTAPSDGTLLISFVGFHSAEVAIAGRNVINVTLIEETIDLDEVVAIGYGVVKKRDLTGAVSSVKADDISRTTVPNAMQAMQARVPGLDIQ